MDNAPVKVVKKALDALEYVVEESLERPGVTLSEVAAHIGDQATTVRNILKTLEQCGYLSRPAGRLYSPGPKCFELARVSLCQDLVSSASAPLDVLAQSTGESVVLAILVGGLRRVLIRVEGGELIRVNSQAADGGSFWSLVTSRVLAAFVSASELDQIITENGDPKPAWSGIESRPQLKSVLAAIHRDRYAEDHLISECYSLAIPLLHSDGMLLGSIGLYMPSFRYSDERKAELLDAMNHAAHDIISRMSLEK